MREATVPAREGQRGHIPVVRHAGRLVLLLCVSIWGILSTGCRTPVVGPGTPLVRTGDEIVVAGQFFHTGTRVVLWMDPGGYDAYRVERRFSPWSEAAWDKGLSQRPASATPNRFGLRQESLNPSQIEQVRGGGWPLSLLQGVVDQFVIHFDASGTSRRCFEVLHDKRCLSVHFMIDLDGTVYQTLDLKERAWHATSSNGRSIGVELASPGAFAVDKPEGLDRWYEPAADGSVKMKIPGGLEKAGFAKSGYVPVPARREAVRGTIQGQDLRQYDFTDAQYESLIRLTASLCTVFPRLRCDYPRDASGGVVREKLPDVALKSHTGLIGHYHIQTDKVDPGPAFNWDRVVDGARRWLPRDRRPPSSP